MNYQVFTSASLTMMYNGVRGALAADDALSDLGAECKFRVRQTPGWKVHAASLEAEMLKRKMFFELIDWSENQTRSPSRNETGEDRAPGFLKPQLAATRASPAVAGTGQGSIACKSRTHQRRSQTRAATMLRPALRENATDPPIAAGGARNLR